MCLQSLTRHQADKHISSELKSVFKCHRRKMLTMPSDVKDNLSNSQASNPTITTNEEVDHIIKRKMSEMFADQFEKLKDNVVTVMASKISGLIEENNSLRLEIKQLRDARETEKKEISVIHQLVKTFNAKLSATEDKHVDAVKEINNKIQSINDNVLTMLEGVPQVTSTEDRFSSIEETISSVLQPRESVPVSSNRSESLPNISSCPYDELMLTITNEVDQRHKRRRNLVIHNVEESVDATQECEKVRDILEEIVKEKSTVDEHLSSMYRLGKQSPGKNRTIKVHFNCENFCQSILQNTKKLRESRLYNNIVIQADLTPLQRNHLKSLVREKKERNQYAIQCNEDPDWVIRMGKLCRKNNL